MPLTSIQFRVGEHCGIYSLGFSSVDQERGVQTVHVQTTLETARMGLDLIALGSRLLWYTAQPEHWFCRLQAQLLSTVSFWPWLENGWRGSCTY